MVIFLDHVQQKMGLAKSIQRRAYALVDFFLRICRFCHRQLPIRAACEFHARDAYLPFAMIADLRYFTIAAPFNGYTTKQVAKIERVARVAAETKVQFAGSG